MDVPVVTQHKFQQSFVDFFRCLSFSSSTECWSFLLCHRVWYALCKLCRRLEIPQRCSWGGSRHARCFSTTGVGLVSASADNSGGSEVAVLPRWSTVPAGAVHRQGVDVPVIMQRRSLAVGSAKDSVHRLIWWTSQFAQRQVSQLGAMMCFFRRILRHFSRSSGCPGVERQFPQLGSSRYEEFFFIEGSGWR